MGNNAKKDLTLNYSKEKFLNTFNKLIASKKQ